MTVQTSANSLERELEYRKKLTSITNQLNSADSIQHILLSLKDKILELLDAERLTDRAATRGHFIKPRPRGS